MDPVSAVGVAAAIAQFVGIAVKVAARLKEYNSAITDLPKSLQHISTQLPLIISSLERLKTAKKVEIVDLSTRCILRGVVDGCKQQVEKINEIIEKVLRAPGDSLVTKFQKVFVSLKNDKKVLDIEKSLQTYISVLILHQVIEGPDPFWANYEAACFFEVHERQALPFHPRTELVQELEAHLNPAATSQAQTPQIVHLIGEKGAGKTQLALECCHRAREVGQFPTTFWLDASTSEHFLRSFEHIADIVHRSTEGWRDRHEKIQFVKSFLRKRWHPWLLVLDNCDPGNCKGLMDSLPTHSCGAIIITARCGLPSLISSKIMRVEKFYNPGEVEYLRSELEVAIEMDNRESVIRLLDRGAKIDGRCSRSSGNRPFLYQAAHFGHDAIMELLLERGARSRRDQTADGYNTALYWAAREGRKSVAQLLLSKEDADGLTPKAPGNNAVLCAAAQRGHKDIVSLIVNHKSVHNDSQVHNGCTALGLAAEHRQTGIVELLLRCGANPNIESAGATPLEWAMRSRSLSVVQILCRIGGADVTTAKYCWFDNKMFQWGVQEAEEIARFLLERGADQSIYPLHHVHSKDTLLMLLQHGADPNSADEYGTYPLQAAAMSCHESLMLILLEHGAEPYPECKGLPPICGIVLWRSDSEQILQLLLRAQARNEAVRNQQQRLALYLASVRGEDNVIKRLLEAGTDIDAVSSAKEMHGLWTVKACHPKERKRITWGRDGGSEGKTPLSLAVGNDNISTARLLLRLGAREDMPDSNGRTPMFIAAERGLDLMLKAILLSTKTTDLRNSEGDTPMHLAAAGGREKAVEMLLELGADRNATNDNGETPFDVALARKERLVIKILEG